MTFFLSLAQGVAAAIVVALLFSLAIFVHEFGHFLAAKLLGFRVDAFALGFGPALWKRRIGQTDYRINAVPFGGYVALPQLDPSGMDTIQGGAGDDTTKRTDAPAWKRIIVALAGPAGNVALATLLAWIIWFAPGAPTGMVSTEIGEVMQGTAAWEAGLRPGEVIEQVGTRRVTTWSDFLVECHLLGSPETGVELSVRSSAPEAALRTVTVAVTNLPGGIRGIAGIYWYGKCQIGELVPGMPAEAAGMLPGDVVETFDGEPVHNSQDFVMRMRDAGVRPVRLELMRKGRPIEIVVTPVLSAEGVTIIGAGVQSAADAAMWMQYRDPWRQIRNDAMQVFRVLQAMIAPHVDGERARVAKSIGGPVIIMAYLWRIVQESFLSSMGFLRMICINLAIINLLPLPVLDGGHIVFALWELITRRKPHPRVVNVLVTGFAILLIALMILLVFKDVLFLSSKQPREQTITAEQ